MTIRASDLRLDIEHEEDSSRLNKCIKQILPIEIIAGELYNVRVRFTNSSG